MKLHPAFGIYTRAGLGLALAAALGCASAAPKAPAKSAKPAEAPAAALTPGQLEAAARVFTGTAQCDQGQQVSVSPVAGREGHFKLQFKKASYTVTPEETQTGAVRLEDKKAGLVWLQIPAKSMLMNAKLGQRVADGCKMAQQTS